MKTLWSGAPAVKESAMPEENIVRETISITAKDGGTFSGYLARPAQGSGPGLILLQEIFGITADLRALADRYAEEGYVTVVPDLFWRLEPGVELGHDEAGRARAFALYERFDEARGVDDIAATIAALRALPSHAGGVGCVGFCLGGKLAYLAAARTDIDCAIGYYGVGIENALDEIGNISVPLMLHIAADDVYCPPEAQAKIQAAFEHRANAAIHVYPGCGHAFAREGGEKFDKPASLIAYSRTLGLLRQVLGPVYDLTALWEKHCYFEFGTRNVDATMATMVSEPYVNHLPTMTGGVGHDNLKRFYRYHFVNANPDDTRLIPISRTVGSDRVVDEMLFCFTHTREIDWMLPGIPPTGRYVEVPLVAIIRFRGDKLYNEHIYWDQASVLVQIGKLDPTGLPVAGAETARKLVDETLPSNTLMAAWASSEGKPI
jgi:carboxymethylenebutenolidase